LDHIRTLPKASTVFSGKAILFFDLIPVDEDKAGLFSATKRASSPAARTGCSPFFLRLNFLLHSQLPVSFIIAAQAGETAEPFGPFFFFPQKTPGLVLPQDAAVFLSLDTTNSSFLLGHPSRQTRAASTFPAVLAVMAHNFSSFRLWISLLPTQKSASLFFFFFGGSSLRRRTEPWFHVLVGLSFFY